jgi:esterase/lipase superfamily enzyme
MSPPFASAPKTRPRLAVSAALLISIILGACAAPKMISTPYVMLGEEGRERFAALPPELKKPQIEVLYVTDRAVDRTDERGPRYGYGRSNDMAFGVATVEYSPVQSWDELVEASTSLHRARGYTPHITRVEELGKFISTTDRMEVKDGVLVRTADAADVWQTEEQAFFSAVERFARHASRKEAVVFIHGYNNAFDDGILRLAEAWHAGGRTGIPIVYTWPAGSGGLKGYAYDRESGEFTIVHLKLLLWALSECPHIEKIHVISHSRGTDVATTTLRELNAEVRGSRPDGPFARRIFKGREEMLQNAPAPIPAYEVFRIETLVLAAPDLDVEVFTQRFMGENLLGAARRTVLYFSDQDQALGMADWLFRSRRRLGALRLTDFNPKARGRVAGLKNLEVINCEVTGHTTHSYILQHPAALSDLLLLLRDGARAGDGRPLTPLEGGLWNLDNNYLKPGASTAHSRPTASAPASR